ncbi:unnamed protein product [Lathyrus oleraceus]
MEESNDLSNLMCFENISTCFENLESDVVDDGSILLSWNQNKNFNSDNPCLSYNNIESMNLLGFFILSDEIILCLVKKETEHLPREDYLERLRGGDMNFNLIDIRNEAIEWIWRASACYGFGPITLSQAVNYLDRFLSVYNFERGRDWSLQLLALACVSIAAKIEDSEISPKSENIEFGESMFVFETKGIHTMELLVLNHLNWKMQSSTPCTFVDHFLRKITCEQQTPSGSSILSSLDLILDITKHIDFLEFRPSEVGAAIAIFVSKELETSEIDDVLTRFSVVEKDKVLKCIEVMQSLTWMEFSTDLNRSRMETFAAESPNGVLDCAMCLSSKSDETTRDELEAISSPESSITSKRHKSFHDGGTSSNHEL